MTPSLSRRTFKMASSVKTAFPATCILCVFLVPMLARQTLGVRLNKQGRSLTYEDLKYKEIDRAHHRESAAKDGRKFCGTSTRRVKSNHFLRDVDSVMSGTPDTHREQRDVSAGTAVYFTARSDALRYNPSSDGVAEISHPREAFSVALWVKPTGGQKSPAVIIGLHDTCRGSRNHWTWSLGVDTDRDRQDHDAHFFFSVTSDRSRASSKVRATGRYEAETWTHLAATFDGSRLTLFVNGAKVAFGKGTAGPMFGEVLTQCKQLIIGGSINDENGFRGAIDQIAIWSGTLNHRELRESYSNPSNPWTIAESRLVVREGFEADWVNWKISAELEPVPIPSDIPGELLRLTARIPSCGVTVCDSPVIARSYVNQPELRARKVIRYRAITMAEDDGSNHTLDRATILRKHATINEAFRPHNISWELTEFVVRNSSLRNRVVLALCNLNQIGDNACDPECRYDVTGDDAGDCNYDSSCVDRQIGNGVCESECNEAYTDYDGGDCCDPTITDVTKTCFDPRSINRNYLTLGELKGTVAMESDSHLNVYFVNFADPDIEGIATMPWEMDVHGLFGGTVLQADACSFTETSAETIVHELGHNLGLWHVHQGMECVDDCREHQASGVLGDLVADTNPTPENAFCRDPTSCELPACFGEAEFADTPYRNFMSYTDAECTDHFTAQQGTRMHCYIDLVYQPWLHQDPSVPTQSTIGIPLGLRVVSERGRAVTLSWLPPMSRFGDGDQVDVTCLECTEMGQLTQYASTAQFYPESVKMLPRYPSPDEATGPPDAGVKCGFSRKSWIGGAKTVCDECYLRLEFKTAVAPAKLIIWANYNTAGGVRNLELEYRDGSLESIGPIEIFCDMPYTMRLTHIGRKVQAIRVYPGEYFSLDAVQLVSMADWSTCVSCKPLNYKVVRNPPFSGGESSRVSRTTTFTDDDVTSDDVTYSYKVQAFRGEEYGDFTSPLRRRFAQEFCGNGLKESANNEECDDGNILDGDGCSQECQIEISFTCEGLSSLCSHTLSTRNTGTTDSTSDLYPVPDDFIDQWVESATANPDHQIKENPVSALVGPPSISTCGKEVETGHGWYPIDMYFHDVNYWIKARFSKAVVATSVFVHLSSDGDPFPGYAPTMISLKLIGPDGEIHDQPLVDRAALCKESPVQFIMTHDLNRPFFHTKEVLISMTDVIAISAVRLRSRKTLDPVVVSSCRSDELFNPATGQCVSYMCTWTECEMLTIPHAVVNCTGLRDGDTCRARCKEGYRTGGVMADAEMVCIDGEWRGPDMICKAVDCGEPSLPYAKIVCPLGKTYGKQCKLKCVPPAKMQGTIQTITCMADGLYSLPEAFCQLLCDAPPIIPNAMLASQQCQMGSHTIDTICKYRCDTGYHVSAQSSKGRRRPQRLKYRCTEDAIWSGPTCDPVTCPHPPIIFNNMYTCTDGFNFNSECRLRCDDSNSGVELEVVNTIRCIQDAHDPSKGVWDGNFTICRSLQGSCDPPQPESNKNVELRCDSGFAVGSHCTAVCPDLYGLSDNEPALLATNSSTMYARNSDWQRDHVIICTAQRQWFPDPRRITCVEGCIETHIANGICQRINNRAYCNWDGGDCCASTTETGEVFTTKDDKDIDVNSLCFDPNAEENQPTNGSNRKNRS